LESLGTANGITLYDDFAHHPTAIAATLEGLRRAVDGARILAVVEPRSNTMKLGTMKARLPDSLGAADRVFCYTSNLGWDAAAAAMRAIASWLDTRDDAALTFVGSSLGGFYATHLAERYGAKAALINPTTRPFDDLKPYLGAQHNPQTGEDYELTPGHFDELAA